jgi:hypothetical protein
MRVFRERFRRARWFYPRVLRFLVEFRVGGCWFRVDLVSGWSPLIGRVFFGFGFWFARDFRMSSRCWWVVLLLYWASRGVESAAITTMEG